MDVQKTMEFILAQQAESAAWQAKADRRIDAATKLLKTGMRMLANTDAKIAALVDAQMRNEDRLNRVAETLEKLAASQERLDASHQRLAEAHEELTKAHQETERSLNRFINSMIRRNGS